jgi:hypothetical protein
MSLQLPRMAIMCQPEPMHDDTRCTLSLSRANSEAQLPVSQKHGVTVGMSMTEKQVKSGFKRSAAPRLIALSGGI